MVYSPNWDVVLVGVIHPGTVVALAINQGQVQVENAFARSVGIQPDIKLDSVVWI